MKRLVLVTHRFPFLPGEDFLETELDYLSRVFDEIHLVPVGNPDSGLRPLPAGITVHRPGSALAVPRGPGLVVAAGGAALAPRDRRWFRSDVRKASARGARAVARLAGRVMAARRVSAWLRRRFPASGASTVFYSYWCATGATALAMMREIEPERVAVARAHGVDLYPEQSSPPYLPLQAQTISRLDRLFVVSRHGVDYLRREYPDLASRLVFSPMGVRAARCLSRASTAGVFRVVSCSYITPIKRLGLIAAALRLSKTPIEWVHIGDGEGRAELEALVASLSPPARGRLLGQLCNREVLDFYEREAVDLFLNVSESEGRPVSIMEALAHGIPVLATAVGGTPELVGAESGLLLPVTITPADLAARLDALSRESRGLVHLREAAVEAWRRSADADRNYPEFARWLESLAGPQTSSAPASSRPTTRSRPGLLLPRTGRMDP